MASVLLDDPKARPHGYDKEALVAAVARAFGLRDLPLVQSLQRSGTHLDLESVILEPTRPSTVALHNFVWRVFGRHWRRTYVLDGREDSDRLRGFVQVAARTTRPEADILFIAPSLSGNGAAPLGEVWQRLLTHACQSAGANQLQRVFAKLPADASDAIEVFRHVGFMVYAQEHVFRLDRLPSSLPPVSLTLRPLESRDNWGVQRLFCHAAPRLVQQVECTGNSNWAVPGVTLSRRPQRFVWEHRGEIRGYISIRRGIYGHWLKMLVDHDDDQFADELLVRALSQLGLTMRPVYCSVRGYEPGLQHALQRQRFRLQTSLLLLVKPTVVPVREPVLTWLAVPERGVEAAPTTSQIQIQAPRRS